MKKTLFIAALCLILGFLAGVLIRQPKINSLKKERDYTKIMSETRYQLIVDQDMEIKRLDEMVQEIADSEEEWRLLAAKYYDMLNPPISTEKPKYNPDTQYQVTVPLAVYALVFERDTMGLDQSVSSAYNPTDYIPNGSKIRIKDAKYCERTQSWWFYVTGSILVSSPPSERFEGWINSAIFVDAPLIEIK